MIGEAFALFSATCFGLAGVTIARGAAKKDGDNGAFLSILLTAAMGGGLWLIMGTETLSPLGNPTVLAGIGFFMVGGMLSTVMGRLAMFRSVVLVGAISASLFRRLTPVFAGVFAWLVLGEVVAGISLLGMAVVMAGVLLAMTDRIPAALRGAGGSESGRMAGRAYGVGASAAYGGAYVARKLGMNQIPDAALGALIGAVTGILWYLIAAPFSARYRAALAGVIRHTGPWQFTTALSMALGQTSMFFALAHADVAIVAIIGATEVFISTWLAAFVFRTEARPSRRVVLASMIAFVGIGVIALA